MMAPKIVFSDFDGTLTDGDGVLGPIFWDILGIIDKLKCELVLVSGRSMSWGHFFLTHFPLKDVIMEGGGVLIKRGPDNMLSEQYLISDEEMLNLNEFSVAMRRGKYGKFLSADSYGRRTDQAIEFFSMDEKDKKNIVDILNDNDMNYSQSNVHLNFWNGEVSKSKAVEFFLAKERPTILKNECLYFGDALNDESMFEYFENTVGVSNIEAVLDQLTTPPKTVLKGPQNAYGQGVYNYLSNLL